MHLVSAENGTAGQSGLGGRLRPSVQTSMFWCYLVYFDALRCYLVRKQGSRGVATKRFSVTLSEHDYDEVRALAEQRRPALSVQYVIEYAVQMLLRAAKDPAFAGTFGNPLAGDTAPVPRGRPR